MSLLDQNCKKLFVKKNIQSENDYSLWKKSRKRSNKNQDRSNKNDKLLKAIRSCKKVVFKPKLSPRSKEIGCYEKKTKADCEKHSDNRCKWDDTWYGYFFANHKCRSRLFDDLKVSYPPSMKDWDKINKAYEKLSKKPKDELTEIEIIDLEVLTSMKQAIKNIDKDLSKQKIKDKDDLKKLFIKKDKAKTQTEEDNIDNLIEKKKKSIMSHFKDFISHPLTVKLFLYAFYTSLSITPIVLIKYLSETWLNIIIESTKLELATSQKLLHQKDSTDSTTKLFGDLGLGLMVRVVLYKFFPIQSGVASLLTDVPTVLAPIFYFFYRKRMTTTDGIRKKSKKMKRNRS